MDINESDSTSPESIFLNNQVMLVKSSFTVMPFPISLSEDTYMISYMPVLHVRTFQLTAEEIAWSDYGTLI